MNFNVKIWICFQLIIHCGVSSIADKITLEKCANRTGYIKTDAFGNVHLTGQCLPPEKGSDVINCDLNIEKICETLNEKNYQSCISDSAGRWEINKTELLTGNGCNNLT